jgi:adenylate cyclase
MALLNHYLSAMIEIIHKHGGTIDEIIGDAILVIFGAPVPMPDAAQRAVCCALEMQKAIGGVNEHNRQNSWPEIEMGLALHTGEVVVGNIGSTKRSKYGVVGQMVNLTARIESFTVGGQVLVSPTLVSAVEHGLILGDEVEIHAKGMRQALNCRELLGHADHPELLLAAEEPKFVALADPVPVYYRELAEKHIDEARRSAALVSLAPRQAVIEAAGHLPRYANIMLEPETASPGAEIYAKVLRALDASPPRYVIRFTSVPTKMRGWLDHLASKVQRV